LSQGIKPEKCAPAELPVAEETADMSGNRDQEPNPFERPGHGPDARGGSGGRAVGTGTVQLLRHDELEPHQLEALEADPDSASALELLREAEHYLWANSPLATLPCPGANELYDFGRGPGYRPLAPGRREELETHLANCESCRELGSTLASPPPMPLVIDPAPEPGAPGPGHGDADSQQPTTDPGPSISPRLLKRPQPRPRPEASLPLRILRFFPVAAALLVLGLGMSFFRKPPAGIVFAPGGTPLGVTGVTGDTGFPANPLLRGSGTAEPAALLHPRGRILARHDQLPGDWLVSVRPHFELATVPAASEYRVVLERLDGNAFSDGSVVERLTADQPTMTASAPLAPGFYRWQAVAVVNGLPRELGAMDFSVVKPTEPEASALVEQLRALDGDGRRVIHAVRLLHGAGYRSDARALARTLPASPGRDAFLAGQLGR
jgi:hypothetical protein